MESFQNVITISVSTNTVDASTQSTPTQATPMTNDLVMEQLVKIMKMLTNISDELSSHGSDIYEIRKKTLSLEDNFEHIMVSSVC